MSGFYWAGYVAGFAGALAVMFSPVLLFATRRGRLLWLPPLLRRVVTGRWRARKPDHARIAELERELGLAFPDLGELGLEGFDLVFQP